MTDDEIVEAMARAIAPLAWQASADNLAQESRRKASLKHARAALAVARPMIEAQRWRPIENAPKDGTPLLICGGVVSWNTGSIGSDVPFVGVAIAQWRRDGTWVDECAISANEWLVYQPTHWMPLPAPPATGENESV